MTLYGFSRCCFLFGTYECIHFLFRPFVPILVCFPCLIRSFSTIFFWVLHQRINPFTSTSLLTFENLSMRYEKSQWMCSKLLFIHFRYERDSFIVQRIHYTCLFFNRHNFPCILYSTQKRFCLYDMTLLALSIFLTLSCILSCSAYIV